MRKVATVTSKGQVTLPVSLRRALKLKSGDKVAFERGDDGRYFIDVRTGSLADLRGLIKTDTPISDDDIERWIAEARGRRSAAFGKDDA